MESSRNVMGASTDYYKLIGQGPMSIRYVDPKIGREKELLFIGGPTS